MYSKELISLKPTVEKAKGGRESELGEFYLQNEICEKLWVYFPKGMWWLNNSAGFFDGVSWRRHASLYAIKGTSDILGVYNGVFYAFEVKRKKELDWWSRARLREGRGEKWIRFKRQENFINKIIAAGGRGGMVHSFECCFSIINNLN